MIFFEKKISMLFLFRDKTNNFYFLFYTCELTFSQGVLCVWHFCFFFFFFTWWNLLRYNERSRRLTWHRMREFGIIAYRPCEQNEKKKDRSEPAHTACDYSRNVRKSRNANVDRRSATEAKRAGTLVWNGPTGGGKSKRHPRVLPKRYICAAVSLFLSLSLSLPFFCSSIIWFSSLICQEPRSGDCGEGEGQMIFVSAIFLQAVSYFDLLLLLFYASIFIFIFQDLPFLVHFPQYLLVIDSEKMISRGEARLPDPFDSKVRQRNFFFCPQSILVCFFFSRCICSNLFSTFSVAKNSHKRYVIVQVCKEDR